MAKIIISAHSHIESFPSNNVPAFARIYSAQPFTNADGESVGAGAPSSQNYIKQVAATYAAGVTTIASFATTNRVDSTTFGTDLSATILSTYTLSLHNANGKLLAIIYTGLIVPVTPTTTTFEDLVTYTNAPRQPYRHDFYTSDQINGLLDDLDLAPDASDVIIGKSRLSVVPVSLSDPIAVGDNDPRVTDVVSRYANLGAAITALSTKKATLVIDADVNATTSVTVPSNVLLEGRPGAVISKSGSGTIAFAGIGLADPLSQNAMFSGFAAGNVTWTGTLYPSAISTELWDTGNTSLSDRLARADLAFPSKRVKIVCYPRTWTGTVTFSQYRHVHFTVGNYPNTIGTNIYMGIFTSDFAMTAEKGAVVNLTPVGGAGFKALSNTTILNNVFFEDLYLLGDFTNTGDAANSNIITGNVHNGYIKNCTIENSYQFTIVGGAGSAGNYAENFSVVGNKWINCSTQDLAVINAKNCLIDSNQFDVRGITTSGNPTLIDVEPNDPTDYVENLVITNNTFDMRAGFNVNAVVVQGTNTVNIKNVIVNNNTMIGSLTTDFILGISIVGVDGLDMNGNNVVTALGLAYQVQDCTNVVIKDNSSYLVGDSSGRLSSLIIGGVHNGQIANNSFKRSQDPTVSATGITEVELPLGVTATGSTVTRADGFFYGIYAFWVGLTFTLNATDYTVQSVTNAYTLVTTVPTGTLPVMTAASATDINTATDTIILGAHNFVNGCVLRYTAGSVAVGGLITATDYYVVGRTGTTIQLAATLAGAVIDLTTTGTGTQTFTPVLITKFSNNTYGDNDADFITLASGGSSLILSDYSRKVGDIVAPTQITSNQNNYNPGRNAHRLDLSTDASRNLTGLAFTHPAQIGGEEHLIYNAWSFNIVLKNASGSSTAANRFVCVTGADITLTPGMMAFVVYSTALSRWITWSTVIEAASLPSAIDAAKIADGSVSNAEFQHLDATSSIQTQLDGKQPLDSDLTAIAALTTTAYGRAFLGLADLAALNAVLGFTATAAEINQFNDVSDYTETLASNTAISISKKYSKLATGGAGACTLAAPNAAQLGMIKIIEMTVDGGDVTISLANVEGGTAATTATFSAVGQKLILMAGVSKWTVLKEFGVVLS